MEIALSIVVFFSIGFVLGFSFGAEGRQKMRKVLLEVRDFIEFGDFDFSNGNVHNNLDEGEVTGTQYLKNLHDKIEEALDE